MACLASLPCAPSRRPGSARRPGKRGSETRPSGRPSWRSVGDRPTTWAGGVFKKRLNDNQHRSIVLAKGGRYWVFAYLFAKKDRANIEPDELAAFRRLAQAYAQMTEIELARALHADDLQELFHEQ